MKKLSRKLLTSITAVVVAIVAVAGSAFAWFTLANTANAEMQFTVVSGDGLEMAYLEGPHVVGDFSGASNWKSTQKIDLSVQKTFGLVTSVDGKTFEGIEADGQNYKMVDVTANNNYFEVTFAFRTQDEGVATDADGAIAKQLSLVNGTEAVGKNSGKAQNAVRVSFTQGLTTSIWEPNYVENSTYGNNNTSVGTDGVDTAKAAYEGTNPAWKKFVDTVVGGNEDHLQFDDGSGPLVDLHITKNTRVSALSEYLNEKPTQANLVQNDTFDAINTLNTGNINNLVWTLNEDDGYYYAAVTVRIWLEGFDGDAYNEIYKQAFSISLVFEKVAKP